MVQRTVVRPQLLFIGLRLPSFVPQRQIPMVQTVQQTTEIPQMPFVFRWSMLLLCRSCGSQVVYLRTQRTAWFDSGYMRCVSLRSFHIFYVYWLTMDPEVDSRPALFWRLLGSTVDTSLCVRLRRLYFSVMLGSTVDTSLCVRLRRLVFLVTIHRLQAGDARHHGQYGPEGQFYSRCSSSSRSSTFPSRRRVWFPWSTLFYRP